MGYIQNPNIPDELKSYTAEQMSKNLFNLSVVLKQPEPQPTTHCCECYYFKIINGVKTCGLHHLFLRDSTVGCYSGWKQRNIEAEN